MKNNKKVHYFSLAACSILLSASLFSQTTSIKGFVEARATLEKGKVSFGLGEQDLFITSELSDRFSFLGETVFKYDAASNTQFSVSIERIVIKYNIKDNHNVLIGKHHTPLNYWNDTYHHGRLFFPTIDRPLLFTAEIIPLHTTGISVQGHDLGKLKFGYDLMIGNGLGSSEITDNDKNKSVSAAIHIKPADKLRIGASYYYDIISKGAHIHNRMINWQVNQQLFSGSAAYFGKKFEVLAEGTAGINKNDSTGTKRTLASYFYGGYKITEKLTPYFRLDDLHYQQGELFFSKNNATSFLLGLRFQFNYLAVIKLEYMHQRFELGGTSDRVTTQVAIGF
jgi:hypothetical protein